MISVAKLCALREKDQNFVAALLTAGLVRQEIIIERLPTVPARYRDAAARAQGWLLFWE